MDQATCGVCRGPFVQPRVLPCGHSFCTNCLQTSIRHNAERSRPFSCPICKKSINATRQRDVENFPRNFDLETLVDLLSKREAGDSGDQSSSPTTQTRQPGASNSSPQTTSTQRQRGRGNSQTNTDNVDLRLAVQMSLADSSGSPVDPETAKEDEDLARAIYFSQLDSNPNEGSSSTHQIQTVNLKISNVHYSLTTDHLLDTFSRFGNIISAKVMRNHRGKSRGYGFVCYDTSSAADTAIRQMNGHELAGRILRVQRAQNSFQ